MPTLADPSLTLCDRAMILIDELFAEYNPDRLDVPTWINTELAKIQQEHARLHGQLPLGIDEEESE